MVKSGGQNHPPVGKFVLGMALNKSLSYLAQQHTTNYYNFLLNDSPTPQMILKTKEKRNLATHSMIAYQQKCVCHCPKEELTSHLK